MPFTATPLSWRAKCNAPTQRCLKSAILRLRDGPSIGYIKMERHFPWPLLTSSKGFKKLFWAQKLPQWRHSTPLFCKTGRTTPLGRGDRDDDHDATISKNRVPPPLQLIVVKLFCEAYSCFTLEETIYHSLWRQRTGEKKMEIVPLQQNICYQIVVVLEVAFLGKKLAEKNRRKFCAKMARKKQTLSSFWFFVFTMIS